MERQQVCLVPEEGILRRGGIKMPVRQVWNPKIRAWVKYEFTKKGWKPLDVKQINPSVPFKDIPIKGKRRK